MIEIMITTTRRMTEEQYGFYKEESPIQPNWAELERLGYCEVTTSIPGEDVRSVYTLKTIKQKPQNDHPHHTTRDDGGNVC
jgi:hypothetical protein